MNAAPSIVCAERARDLLVAACAAADPALVLLPGLYCGEVAGAIGEAGLRWRCYDLDSRLDPILDFDGLPAARVCLVWCHLFGMVRPVPSLPAGVRVVEDCCHALRSWLARGMTWPADRPAVFSPRKELGWREGGVAAWPGTRLPSWPPQAGAIRARWDALHLEEEIDHGRARTRAARAALGARLPPGDADDVLTYLPLLTTDAGPAIDALRAQGLDAWRWLDAPCLRRPEEAPAANELWRMLVLVRLDEGADGARLLEAVRSACWRSWPDA
jgi:hypothetical protein